MDQEQEDRRPTDSDIPYKKQRPNTPPVQNPNGYEEQQAGRRKRRSRKAKKSRRKSSRRSRRYRH